MLEIGELIVRSDPAPRAYITSSLRSWNDTSDVRLIEPLTVASSQQVKPRERQRAARWAGGNSIHTD